MKKDTKMSEVFANLKFPNGETIEVTPDMARLYTHLGNYAVYDHVFIITDQEKLKGLYVWAQIPPDNPTYEALAPAVATNDCELHIRLRTPSEQDVTAFENHAKGDEDEIPDWLPEV